LKNNAIVSTYNEKVTKLNVEASEGAAERYKLSFRMAAIQSSCEEIFFTGLIQPT
jgi:hypothetical protein